MKIKDKFGKINLMKGFVFKSVFEPRPDLCKSLVEITCGIKVDEITVAKREHVFDFLPDVAGGRVDLFLSDEKGYQYDLEVQVACNDDEHLRARRYQALMDVAQLRRGQKVELLKPSIVVFICAFDPFTQNLARYITYTTCEETGMRVEDGRLAIYLNIKGDRSQLDDPELSDLLDTFSGEGDTETENTFIRGIIDEMEKYQADPEWMKQFMTLEEAIEAEARALAEELAKKMTEEISKERDEAKAENERLRKEIEHFKNMQDHAGDDNA